MSDQDLSQLSMLDLFRVEAESQAQVLTAGLLALERDPRSADQLEACMRAAHSLKGAARIVGLDAGVRLRTRWRIASSPRSKAASTLRQDAYRPAAARRRPADRGIAHTPEADARAAGTARDESRMSTAALAALPRDSRGNARAPARRRGAGAGGRPTTLPPWPSWRSLRATPRAAPAQRPRARGPRAARVSADNLNRLLGLAGESLVESRWLKPFAASLLRLKRLQHELGKALDDAAATALRDSALGRCARTRALAEAQPPRGRVRAVPGASGWPSSRCSTAGRSHLAHRLYEEALACRMRPFADGVDGLPRMVRDLARSLGKQVRLEIVGGATQVDRDILEQLDAPLGHLLRNAVDHGIEPPEERAGRRQAGRRRSCGSRRATAPACCRSSCRDDGRGIDLERLREAVVARKLTTAETAARAERSRAARVPVPARLHDEGRRSPRSRAAASGSTWCRTWSSRCAAPCASSSQPGARHALPAAAAADALGRAHAAGRDRRRALRLPARLHRRARSSCRGTRSSCSKAASISTSTASTIGLVTRAPDPRRRRRQPRPATICR